jgi:hypothetical protein
MSWHRVSGEAILVQGDLGLSSSITKSRSGRHRDHRPSKDRGTAEREFRRTCQSPPFSCTFRAMPVTMWTVHTITTLGHTAVEKPIQATPKADSEMRRRRSRADVQLDTASLALSRSGNLV